MLQNRITRLESELAASVALNPASSTEPAESSTPARPPRVRLGAEVSSNYLHPLVENFHTHDLHTKKMFKLSAN